MKMLLVISFIVLTSFAYAETYDCLTVVDGIEVDLTVSKNDESTCGKNSEICLSVNGGKSLSGKGSFNDDRINFVGNEYCQLLVWDYDSQTGFYRDEYCVSRKISCNYNYQQK